MIAFTKFTVNIDIKSKRNFGDNQLHNILRLFDVLPNFPFTTIETIPDFYSQIWYIQVFSQFAERLKTYDIGP